MGVVNVTPDSFSDGGIFLDVDAAVEHGERLAAEGADILDLGGESTRPGAQPVALDEELRRVVPVVERLAPRVDVPLSVDTTKAGVAAAALDAGASVVNDISAGRHDPDMLRLVADRDAGLVLMHMQGRPATMQDDPVYGDVVDEVASFLVERVEAAVDAGVDRSKIWVDPGIGFGKAFDHNLALLADLDEIVERVGVPVLVGTSRKGFIGAILDAPVTERDEGTLATVVWAVQKGAAMVRVHDVRSVARVARLLDVLARATPDGVVPATEEAA